MNKEAVIKVIIGFVLVLFNSNFVLAGVVLDTTFNGSGVLVSNLNGGECTDIVKDSNNRLVIVGDSLNISGSNTDMTIWRYNSDGTLDTSFNSVGYVKHDNAAGGNTDDYGNSVALDSTGRIIVAGFSMSPTDNDMVIWRYNSTGTLDTSFNGTGFVVFNNAAGGNGDDLGNSIIIDSNGKIIVAGYSNNGTNNDMVIWRYNSDGTLDTSFNGTGIVVHNNAGGANSHDKGNSITMDSSGKIIVAGESRGVANYDMAIWRYNSNGTLDASFNGVGYVTHNNAGGGNAYDTGLSVVVGSSGKILVAGYSNAVSNQDMTIWRYNSDGSPDTSFNGIGYITHRSAAGGTGTDWGAVLIVESNDRITVGGSSVKALGGSLMTVWKYAFTAPVVLDNIKGYPNPFNPNRSPAIQFKNLTAGAIVRIYTVSGQKINEVAADTFGIASWNGTNSSGSAVASGIYLGYVSDGTNKKTIKIAVEK